MIVAEIFAPCSVDNFYLSAYYYFYFWEPGKWKHLWRWNGDLIFQTLWNVLSFIFCIAQILKIKNQGNYDFSSTTFYDALIFSITRFSVNLWKYFKKNHVCLQFEIIVAYYITYNDSLLSSRTMTDNESDVYVSAAMHHYRNWMTRLFSVSICDENIQGSKGISWSTDYNSQRKNLVYLQPT